MFTGQLEKRQIFLTFQAVEYNFLCIVPLVNFFLLIEKIFINKKYEFYLKQDPGLEKDRKFVTKLVFKGKFDERND